VNVIIPKKDSIQSTWFLTCTILDATKKPVFQKTILIGMIPIAIATGSGAEWKNGLAWVLIGGLTSSMFLTIIVVPMMYYVVDRLKDRFAARAERLLAKIED
jgi:HAE1 family hydrophobic/amphiphilic exporter-1